MDKCHDLLNNLLSSIRFKSKNKTPSKENNPTSLVSVIPLKIVNPTSMEEGEILELEKMLQQQKKR